MRLHALVSACALVLLFGCSTPPTSVPAPPAPAPSPAPSGEPEGIAPPQGLVRLQPGDVMRHPPGAVNADVTQHTIGETICKPNWTATVRPSSTYTNGVKAKLLREHGLPAADAGRYELDHFIPLALGGHPRSIDNLWLQSWEGPFGARRKDLLEVRLKNAACAGTMTLAAARRAITSGWRAALERVVPETAPTLLAEPVE